MKWILRGLRGPSEKEVRDSERRLEETENRWDEIQIAQKRIDNFIQRALRGGPA